MSASSPSPNSLPLAPPPPGSTINADPPESSTPPPLTSPPSAPLAPPPISVTSPPPMSTPPPVPASSPPPPPALPPNSVATPPPVSSPPPVPATSPPPVSSPPPTPTISPPPANPPPPVPAASPPPPNAPPPSTPSSPPLVPATPPTNSPPPPSPPPVSAQPPEAPNPPSASPPSPPPPLTSPPPSPNEPSPSPPTQEPPSASPPPNISPTTPAQISPPVSNLSPPLASPPPPGNLSLAPPPPGNSTDSSRSSSGVPMAGIVAVGVGAGIILLGLIGVIVWCIVKRKRRGSERKSHYVQAHSHGYSLHPDSSSIIQTEVSTPIVKSGSGSGALKENNQGRLGYSRSSFTYQELYEATNGFASDNLLGEGGFGSVYKGVLENGREVAVKQLKVGGNQGEREFKAEIDIISCIHHRHLVPLAGYCIFESRRLLVYDYMPNQTLYYHLHGQNRPVLDWATRIKIAVGAARGIAYLHEDCHPRIIHRDIKSSNILLDAKFEARVSDFGLAKLALDVDTHISTRVMGTFGYMAPEYATSGKLTEKSDVYSFGVVLLELVTGRRPVDESQPAGDESLVLWARPLLSHALDEGEVEELVDPRLEKKYVESELFLIIEAAASCVRHSASKRPQMGQVLRAFDALSPSDLSNGMRVGESEIYDPAQQSAHLRWIRRLAFGNGEYSTDYLSTENSRNGLSREPPSQNIYFSSQHTQNPTFSGQRSTPDSSGQSSQNPAFSGQSTTPESSLSGQNGQNHNF